MRLFRRGDAREELDDELEFHLFMRITDLESRGLSPAAARERAEREFGDVHAVRDACLTIDERRERHARRLEVRVEMLNDLRFAVRALRKSPGFTTVAVLCIALGVGVVTTIFSAVHATLIRPLPYPNADELVAVYGRNTSRGINGVNISYPDYLSWRDESRSFRQLGMWTWSSYALAGEGEPERVDGADVTPNLFPLLGVRPLLGRPFADDEARDTTRHVVLLGYGLWQRRYGGARDIVGRAVTINGQSFTVVGVMPPRFAFPDRGQMWTPLVVDLAREDHGNRYFAGAIGRLKPGVTPQQAERDLDVISARIARDFPRGNEGWDAQVVTMRQDLVGDFRKPLLIFLGAVAMVLLIACANVANLMLARAATRERDIAIRVALGAGRGRIAWELFAESIVIAVVGGALGALIAVFGVRMLALAFPDGTPFYLTLSLDGTALAFASVLALGTSVLFGLVPAIRAARPRITGTLRATERGGGGGVSRSRLRASLVVAEVALSLVLMIGASLLIRSYQAYATTDLGFRERGILSMRISLPAATYPERARRLAFYDELLTRLRALPGVESVGTAQGIPFSGFDLQGPIAVQGRPAPAEQDQIFAHFQRVSPDYFKTMGVPLVRGRWLTAADRDSMAPPALINESYVKKAFPNTDPIGQRIKIGSPTSPDPWYTVVGVIGDYRHYRLPQPMGPAMYFPYATQPGTTQFIVLRTNAPDPMSLLPALRREVHAMDANIPIYQIATLDDVVSRSLWRQRLESQVLGLFAAMALLLATVGLYGVIAYSVAQRTRELGVRMALGAQRRTVIALVLSQGARLAITGIALGLVVALILVRSISSLLYGVGTLDAITFAGVPLVLAAVAVLASWVPARKASRVDPIIAMRAE